MANVTIFLLSDDGSVYSTKHHANYGGNYGQNGFGSISFKEFGIKV